MLVAIVVAPVWFDLKGPRVFAPDLTAQTRFSYSSGQELSPSYEGWMPNDDGSFTLYFGYMNTNWLQEFDIPVGPDNHFEGQGVQADMGQPTHFYPRRNPFLFTFKVPKDFGTKEIIWILSANGKSDKAYASLKTDYQIDKQVISTEVGGDNGSLDDSLRDNLPPDLKIEGPEEADRESRSASVADCDCRRSGQYSGAARSQAAARLPQSSGAGREPERPGSAAAGSARSGRRRAGRLRRRSTARPSPSSPRAVRACACRGSSIAAKRPRRHSRRIR